MRIVPVAVGAAAAVVLVAGAVAAATVDPSGAGGGAASAVVVPSSSAAPRPTASASDSTPAAAPTTAASSASSVPAPIVGTAAEPTSTPTTSAGTTPRPAAVALPPVGSYAYATSGSERISIAGSERSFPPTTTISVAKSGCGEQETWTPSAQHTESEVVCLAGDAVRVATLSQTESFYGQSTSDTFTCTDAIIATATEQPGDTRTFTCTAPDAHAAATVRFVGLETVARTATKHVHVVTTITGQESGTQTSDYWFRADSVTAKQVTVTHVSSQTPYGAITYDGSWTLALDEWSGMTKPSGPQERGEPDDPN